VQHCLFIVASKSGTTTEPIVFHRYWHNEVAKTSSEPGKSFVTITDPGSQMADTAAGENFKRIFLNQPDIGGRYSALSYFGMVPAAIMGVDVERFLTRTEAMVQACAASVSAENNPGVVLGAILGAAATQFGRDKVTIIASPGIHDLGAWLEQLIAESTGKIGKGLIPVDRENLAGPAAYGVDRVFAYLRLETAADATQDAAVDKLEAAGQPVIRIAIDEKYDLGQEFFRWEIATAVACSIIGVNAFNQPDVEASKIVTKELTTAYEQIGKLPEEAPFFADDGIKLFTDEKNILALNAVVGSE